MKIKITKLDSLYSRYMRLKAHHLCERCGRAGTQTHHHYTRGIKRTRYYDDNTIWCDFGCHQHFHKYPAEHVEFWIKRIGQKRFDVLRLKAHNTAEKVDLKVIEIWLTHELKKLECDGVIGTKA